MVSISRRVLPLLQLTRMALVFTAIADASCTLLLWGQKRKLADGLVIPAWRVPTRTQWGLMLAMSVGLYGFGMSLNDIIDRRRDRQIAAHRPLPSGRVGLVTAHAVCVGLIVMALVAAQAYSVDEPGDRLTFFIACFTAVLIAFYDFAGKYLVAPGLLTLGLVRFFHASVAAPTLPLLWHPLVLLNHVTILSAVGYVWEQKRPALTRVHWWCVLGGLAALDFLVVTLVWAHRDGISLTRASFAHSLWVTPGLLYPAAAAAAFTVLAVVIYKRNANPRQAGQTLMLAGLLWLIVFDASFVAGYVGWKPGMAMLALLPVAYLSVQVMRWWSTLVALSHRPAFKRVEA